MTSGEKLIRLPLTTKSKRNFKDNAFFTGGLGVLENFKNSKKTVGIKQTLKAVDRGKAEVVFIARDAEEKLVEGLKQACLKNSVEIIYVDSMKQLGKACNIEVGAAAAAILKEETEKGGAGDANV